MTAAVKRRRRRESRAASALARCRVFGLLASALRYPDEHLFDSLRDGRWAVRTSEAARAGGVQRLDPFLAELRRLPETLPTGLAVLQSQHTALFSSGTVCPHHESDYLASHTFQKADLMADVAGFYAAFGFRLSNAHRELADFLGTELEFLHLAGWKEAYALRRGNRPAAAVCRQAQEKFLVEHLGVWVSRFREGMERNPSGRFYILLARLVESFVQALGVRPPPPCSWPCGLATPLPEQPPCLGCP